MRAAAAPSWFSHDDASFGCEILVEQGDWNPRGLARARRRDKGDAIAAAKNHAQCVEHIVDRKRRIEACHRMTVLRSLSDSAPSGACCQGV
jgi:hypothetical protein